VGVHAGPCYAVTSNRALDYFGQTVNVAARMEGLADGGEIVASEASLGPGALPAGLRLVERVRVTPRGLPGPVSVARLRLNEEALRRAA
jgi:class 3 adenylate cyclase